MLGHYLLHTRPQFVVSHQVLPLHTTRVGITIIQPTDIDIINFVTKEVDKHDGRMIITHYQRVDRYAHDTNHSFVYRH